MGKETALAQNSTQNGKNVSIRDVQIGPDGTYAPSVRSNIDRSGNLDKMGDM
jgi:hypothetical protein